MIMSAASQLTPTRGIPLAAGIQELAASVIRLLQTATKEVERDSEAAKTFIARASELLQVEVDRSGYPGREVRSGGLAPWQIQRVKVFVEQRLSESIRIEDLSVAVRLSKPHFSRIFKRSFGESPHVYLVHRRVCRAQHLMLTTDIGLSELAVACGFSDQAHLCRIFRKTAGQSPAAWRRERCQSALKIAPPSASKTDPPRSMLVPVVHRGDPRGAECPFKG
jgi:AraC family transcriptional regulator